MYVIYLLFVYIQSFSGSVSENIMVWQMRGTFLLVSTLLTHIHLFRLLPFSSASLSDVSYHRRGFVVVMWHLMFRVGQL